MKRFVYVYGKEIILSRSEEAVETSYKEFLREWFYGILGFEDLAERGWGRDFGDPRRVFIPVDEDLGALFGRIRLCQERGRPCFLSVNYYSGSSGAPGVVRGLEKLFFDLDSPGDLSRAERDARRLADYLSSHCRPLVVFSGGKGFHVYCYLGEIVSGDRVFLKHVLERLVDKLGYPPLTSLDERVVCDVSRLSRIPYTLHEKTGRRVVVLDEKDFKPVEPESISLREYWGKPLPVSMVRETVSFIRELGVLGATRGKSRKRKKSLAEATWITFFEEPGMLERVLAGVSGELRTRHAKQLALYYRNIEMLSKDECLEKLLEWNKKNKPPLPTSIVEKIVEEAYLYEKQ